MDAGRFLSMKRPSQEKEVKNLNFRALLGEGTPSKMLLNHKSDKKQVTETGKSYIIYLQS